MAGIKHEEKIHFASGHIYVVMDDELGVEIIGENEIGGDLVTMESWDFTTAETWSKWGTICIQTIRKFNQLVKSGELNENDLTDRIYEIEKLMPSKIKAAQI